MIDHTCSFCGARPEAHFEACDENRRVSDERFAYEKCPGCGVIALPRPPGDLSRYYRDEYYEIPPLDRLKQLAGKSPGKLATVLRFATQGRLLEIGPAFGVFAWQAKSAGFSVDAIEMDARCCEFLKDTLGVNAVRSDVPHLAMQSMGPHEVVAIWHVLEHLPDPVAFLRAAAQNLAEGGVLCIGMPNPDAFQFHVMGRKWPHLDAPRHLNLIPAEILTDKAREFGLERIFLTSDDADARSWNRFGWQRLLMNSFGGRWIQRVMFLLGYALSVIMSPFDRRQDKGSAYTAVFRKKAPK